MLYLRYYIYHNNFKKVGSVFHDAKRRLGPSGHELWRVYLLFLRTIINPEAVKEFNLLVHELALQNHSNFNQLKADVIEMQGIMISMKRARKTYHLFVKNFPKCYEVHEKMADISAKRVITNFIIHMKYEIAIQYFYQLINFSFINSFNVI